MTEQAAPKMPAKLGSAGRDLWRSIIPAYQLRPDEIRVLTDACREADVIARLEADLETAPLMVKGSMGQLVASPLVSEVRAHRTVLNNLLKALKLPDGEAGRQRRKDYTSEQARKAARARWGTPRSA